MEAFAREKLGLGREALEHIVILETALPLDQLPRLYKGAGNPNPNTPNPYPVTPDPQP